MPVIKCTVGRVYCGPKFEKLRLNKDESMTVEPGQISFFQKLIDSKAIVILDEQAESKAAPKPVEVEAPKIKEDFRQSISGEIINTGKYNQEAVPNIELPSIAQKLVKEKKNKKIKHKRK